VGQYIVSPEIDSNYSKESYAFPNYKRNPKEKREKPYSIDVAKTIYAKHIQGKTGISLSLSSEFDTNRMFGSSTEPVSIYMNRLSDDNNSTSQNSSQYDNDTIGDRKTAREGWMNVDWTSLNVMSKIKNALHGMYDNAEYDIVARAIDQKAGAEREEMKFLSVVYKYFGQEIQQLYATAEIPNFEPAFVPESEIELTIFENAGGFKLVNEIAIEEIIQHTLDISDWRDIKEKLLDDIIDVGRIAVRKYFDDASQKIIYEYIDPDPKYLIIQKSKHWDYKDAEYAGYVYWHKISYLRDKGVSEDLLPDLAQKYSGIYGNPGVNEWSYYNKYENATWKFDDFRVPVFTCEWIDSDTSKKLIYTTLEGRVRVKELGYDDKIKEKDKQHIDSTYKKKRYTCSWVIDTDVAFDYGLDYNQERNPKLNIQVRELRSAPLVSVLIPHIKQLNLAWFKFQNALSQLRVMGFAVDFDALDNIQLSNGEKLDQLEILRMAMTIGILPFRRTKFDGSLQSMASTPIQDLPSGMGNVLQDLMQIFQWEYSQLEQLSGINQAFLGGMPAPRTGKAVVETAINSSSTVTKPLIDCIMQLKSSIAEVTSNCAVVLFKVNKKAQESYARVIGNAKVQNMIIASAHAEYGIKLEPKPTDNDWANLYKYIDIALSSGRDGRPGLDIDVAFQIEQMRQNGMNLKQITMMVMNAIRKIKKQEMQKQMALTQQQQNNNMQLMQEKNKTEISKLQGQIAKQEKDWDRKDTHEVIKQEGKAGMSILDNKLNSPQQLAMNL